MSKTKQHRDYKKWKRRIEGQVRNCVNAHPKWFKPASERDKTFLINSFVKRIVGEIIADLKLADSTK